MVSEYHVRHRLGVSGSILAPVLFGRTEGSGIENFRNSNRNFYRVDGCDTLLPPLPRRHIGQDTSAVVGRVQIPVLSVDRIGSIRKVCGELDVVGLTAFTVAAVHRVLPAYQVYGEVHADIRGHRAVHDALVAIPRLLRRQPGVTRPQVARAVDTALTGASRDLAVLRGRTPPGLAESMAAEVISAAVLVLNSWKSPSSEGCAQAVITALAVDDAWSGGVQVHYGQLLRDARELAAAGGPGSPDSYLALLSRAERESEVHLQRMKSLLV